MTSSRKRLLPIVFMLVVMLAVPVSAAAAAPAAAAGNSSDRSAVVRTWERISIRTIYTERGTVIPVGALYLGFASLAMYRAAQAADARRGSAEAAVAVAAHDVLAEYFPASVAALDTDLTATLSALPRGGVTQRGEQAGRQAARDLIADRVGDGRGNGSVVYSKVAAPGVWPADATLKEGMLVPWLGFVRPLLLDHPIRARGVTGPDPLTSARYAADYNEVKRLGSKESADRTTDQTDTAQFFNSNSAIMITEGVLRYLDAHPLRLTDTARLFAAMHTAEGDAVITCWRLKYEVGFWRPFQAIHAADTDGNPATAPDPAWTPLIANPPYSDYVSGHGCLTSPTVQVIRRTLGENTPLRLHSYSTLIQLTDRDYRTLGAIEHDAFHARIWGGLHFRNAMNDAYAIGHAAANQVLYRLH